MTARRLGLGVVGANPNVGWASRTHMPAFAALPDFDLAAVCTTKPESAAAAAEKYEAERGYSDYREMVQDPKVDIVDVCVKVPYHFDIVMAALQAGKHVYCEWPLGATTAQAEEMANLAVKQGVRTMVGLQARGAPSIQHLRQLLADGYVGRVLSATLLQFQPGLLQERTEDGTWRADRAAGANTLSISTGHDIDAFCYCLGGFAALSAIVDTLVPEWPMAGGGTWPVSAPDHITVQGRLTSGAVATVEIGAIPWHASGVRLEIYGTEGTIIGTSSQQLQFVGLQLQGAHRGDAGLQPIEVPAALRQISDAVPNGTPVNLAQMMRSFAGGIASGVDVGPTFADAVQNHRLLDAMVRSSETSQVVRVA